MKRIKMIGFGVILTFVASIFLFKSVRPYGLMAGTIGTVKATANAFYTEIESSRKSSPIRDFAKELPAGKHVLDAQRYKEFTNFLKTRHNLDISNDWGQDQIMRDFWGQPFRIIFDKRADGLCDVEVVSSGWDKEFGEHDVSNIR